MDEAGDGEGGCDQGDSEPGCPRNDLPGLLVDGPMQLGLQRMLDADHFACELGNAGLHVPAIIVAAAGRVNIVGRRLPPGNDERAFVSGQTLGRP